MNSRGYRHKNQDRGWSFVGRSKRYDLAEDETTRRMVDAVTQHSAIVAASCRKVSGAAKA